MKIEITKMSRWKQEELIMGYEHKGYITHLSRINSRLYLKVYKQ